MRAGSEGRLQSKTRLARRLAEAASDTVNEDAVLRHRWMAAQNQQSQRHERSARYLKDGSEELLRHDLSHYVSLLGAIEEATESLQEPYVAALKVFEGLATSHEEREDV